MYISQPGFTWSVYVMERAGDSNVLYTQCMRFHMITLYYHWVNNLYYVCVTIQDNSLLPVDKLSVCFYMRLYYNLYICVSIQDNSLLPVGRQPGGDPEDAASHWSSQ